ncbi:MAG: hypothetical protein N0E38_07880 [Candidatus Thiodiazotropha endolucinida]|nr:hypothetical protein [Candidatus Thiodiazotropha taylori]MCW4348862.1 hypothetical protein [Candidatus Thiodiazotropha endolucinida]
MPNNEVYRDLSRPLVKETKLSSPKRAHSTPTSAAAPRLSVSPVASPQHTTLQSIKTGGALKQAYLERRPITAVKEVLKHGGESVYPTISLRNGKTPAIASLGDQTIQSTQLLKGVKEKVSTVYGAGVKTALVQARSIPGAESDSSYIKRLKAADKDLKSTQKAINRVLKNAEKAVSKHVDEVFRAQQKSAAFDVKIIRTELSGLRAELRTDLKKIQTMPVRSNEVALKNLGARPASVGSLESSHFEKYKPQSEADRAEKFHRRWKDGRVEIQRVDRKLDDQVARMKADRVARKWLKKKLSQDVRGAGKELTGEVQRLRLRNKGHIQRTKQLMQKTRMKNLRTRLARILR